MTGVQVKVLSVVQMSGGLSLLRTGDVGVMMVVGGGRGSLLLPSVVTHDGHCQQ